MQAQTTQQVTGIKKQRVVKTDTVERRRRYMVRWTSLRAERGRHYKTWQALTNYIMPERGRFMSTDHNKPKDTSKILNSITTRYARSLAAGLMSGMTPLARPWHNLTLPDPDLAKRPRVREWLYDCTIRQRQVFDLSGFYRAVAMGVYPDLAVYGLGTMICEEDERKILRFIPLAMGTYALAQDGHGRVNCLMYEEPWTVGELVQEFGWDQVSSSVKTAWNGGILEQYVNVLRVIMPNDEFIPGAFGPRGMQYGSVYMEVGGLNSFSGAQPATDQTIGFLREEGYPDFPVLVARWTTTSRDVYPTGPGHDVLPECRQLMQLESRELLALAKGVNPALMMPEIMRVNRLSALPGDGVYLPSGVKAEDIKPAQVVDVRWMEEARSKAQETVERIGSGFYADLMRRLIDKPAGQGKQPVTAEEIVALKEETLLQLGPVLENMNEFLADLVDRSWGIMERRGLIPPAPREIRGMLIKAEFISILAQAQKVLYTAPKERFLAFAGQLAQLMAAKGQTGPAEVVDNLNADKMLTRYADDIGIPPDTLNDPAVVQKARQQRAQAMAEAQQHQAALDAADAAKSLGQADLGGDSMLKRIVGPQANAEQA